MTLEFVTHDPALNINVLLYGGAKAGKSTGAASAPGPILYLNCEQANATRFARMHSDQEILEVKVTGLQTLIDVIHELENGTTKYRSVVVDPVGDLYRIVLEDLSGRALKPKINDYGDAGTHVERFCRALCEMPLNAVLVLHEIVEHDEESGAFERLPFASTKSGSAVFGAKLMAMVDVIGYCGVVEGEGEQPAQYLAQLISANGRRGGDRFGVLGKSREVDLVEWVRLAREATTKTSTKDVKNKEE